MALRQPTINPRRKLTKISRKNQNHLESSHRNPISIKPTAAMLEETLNMRECRLVVILVDSSQGYENTFSFDIFRCLFDK